MAAPSACNQQPWRFTVVRRQDLKERLAAASPFAGFAAQAPVILVPAFRKVARRQGMLVDTSSAVESRAGRGATRLGAVWLGVYPRPERMATVAKSLRFAAGSSLRHGGHGLSPRRPQPVHPFHADWIRRVK